MSILPTTMRAMMRAEITAAADDDRTITVVCSTERLGRDDIVLRSAGIELDNYRANPVFLYQHNPDWPVARAEDIKVVGGDLVARVKFPPEGVSARADEVLGLVRAGVLNGISTGFDPKETEPLDPANRNGGILIKRCELHEVSIVSIPAVPDALVAQRAMDEARSRMSSPEPRALSRPLVARDLYDVAGLAYLLQELGWIKSCADWEAEIEQDASQVPAMLGDALKSLGDCLVAMAAEEVAELVGEESEPVAAADETEIVTASSTPALARFRLGVHRLAKHRQSKPEAETTTEITRKTGIAYRRRMAALFERELSIGA